MLASSSSLRLSALLIDAPTNIAPRSLPSPGPV